MNASKFFALFVLIVATVALSASAHKRHFQSAPIYEPPNERCVCDCARPQPVLPNRPYFGNAGYHQQPPRPSGGGGYGGGNSGSYAVAGSYGSGSGQASGGY